MGRKCYAPNCGTGKDNVEKCRVGKKPSLHNFPADPERRAEWVRRTPRSGITVDSVEGKQLCSLHFRDMDFQQSKVDRRDGRGDELALKILKPEAVPTVWPNCPSYMTTPEVMSRTTTMSSSEERRKAEKERNTIHFKNLLELEAHVRATSGEGFSIVGEHGCFAILRVNLLEGLCVMYGIKIFDNLEFEVFCRGVHVENSVLLPKCSVSTLSDSTKLSTVLSRLETYYTQEQDVPATVVEYVRKILESSPISEDPKIGFMCEQLALLSKKANGRRYSPSLLAMCCELERISPASYKQLYADGVLTLPSPKHLRRISSALTTDLNFSASTVQYLKARLSKLGAKDKIVAIIMDEVHSEKKSELSNGVLYGTDEHGNLTKTLLCVMIKSVAGRYQDVISMTPITNLTAEKLHTIWKNCLEQITEIGFDSVATITDGLRTNVKFFKSLDKSNKSKSVPEYVENPSSPGKRNYLLCDSVHLLKNIYGNLINYGTFECPSFDDENTTLTAQLDHIVQLYNKELAMPLKMAHKLTHKVLNPSNVEKTNVKLADAFFHESTINALLYYADRDHPEWRETAEVLRIIRNWFNTVNVRSKYDGERTLDPHRNPIKREDRQFSMNFLRKFLAWVEKWKKSGKKGLSDQTFEALTLTSRNLIGLVNYILDEKPVEYILLGNISQDPLEGRFGWYRQLNGANYQNSVRQFLEAEKNIRLRTLIRSGFDMTQIKQIFDVDEEKVALEKASEVKDFLEVIQDFTFEQKIMLAHNDKKIIHYYARYIARSILQKKNIKCADCLQMVSNGKTLAPTIITDENDSDPDRDLLESSEQFTSLVSRGGLLHPSDILYLVCVHAWALWRDVRDDSTTMNSLMKTTNQRRVFVAAFMNKLEESERTQSILHASCNKGHKFTGTIEKTCAAIFNGMAGNMTKVQNSKVHAGKKRDATSTKPTAAKRKILKLSSGNSVTTNVSVAEVPDCGICKYCKDKPKNGGKGTLRKKCVEKSR